MSWSAVVFGELNFPAAEEKKWRVLEVTPNQWSDWPNELVATEEPIVVGPVLDELTAVDEGTWLRLARKGDRLQIVGLLHEEAYGDSQTSLVAAFRAASRLGATGEVTLGDTELVDFAWRIRLKDGASTLTALSDEERAKLRPRAMDAVTKELQRRTAVVAPTAVSGAPILDLLEFVADPSFKVRYRASAEPQELTITARLQSGEYFHITNCVTLNHRYGMVGSDLFAPALGELAMVANEQREDHVKATYRVVAMAPILMRRIVEQLRRMAIHKPPLRELQVIGSLALDGSPLSATEEQVRAWLADPTAYARPWTSLTVPVVARPSPKKGIAIRVVFERPPAEELHKKIQTRFLAWSTFVGGYVSPDGGYVEQKEDATPSYAWKEGALTVKLSAFHRARGPAADVMRNMLQLIHEQMAPIERVELAL